MLYTNEFIYPTYLMNISLRYVKHFVNLIWTSHNQPLKSVEKSEDKGANMASIEQELMVMLQQLPVPITITWQNSQYHWQCVEGHGSSPDLVGATGQALRYLMTFLASDTSKITNISHESRAV
jgi:hypothetical protein